jgi:hypothetical protein
MLPHNDKFDEYKVLFRLQGRRVADAWRREY